MATVELFVGFPYVALLWMTGLRISFDNVKTLSLQAFFLVATHVLGVISFGAGAISFMHIIKTTVSCGHPSSWVCVLRKCSRCLFT